MPLTTYEIWTYQDAVERVLDAVAGADDSPRNIRLAKRAVSDAYHDLPAYRTWSYYYELLPIATQAQIQGGTLQYQHTGGASPRLVTLTGAPVLTADVEHFDLIVNDLRYEVDQFLSASTFTLSERVNPGADIAAGASYSLVRDTYPLPDDFGAMGLLLDVTGSTYPLDHVPMDSLLLDRRILGTTSQPTKYATGRTNRYAGGQAIVFGPSPVEVRRYDAIMRIRPKALKTYRDTAGKVTTTAGSTLVVCDTATFTQDHVGAVLRVSIDDQLLPTSLIGGTDDSDNPAAFQGVVRSVTNTTNLLLEQPAEIALAAKPFTISSRLDLEAGAMLTAFWAMAEAKFAQLAGLEGAIGRAKLSQQKLLEAAEADGRHFGTAQSMIPRWVCPEPIVNRSLS